MIKEEYKHSALTPNIIGCAMQVHGFLGNGFQEVIYQRALQLEFASGLQFKRVINTLKKSATSLNQ